MTGTNLPETYSMVIPIDPNYQVYSDGVVNWIRKNRKSPDLFAKAIRRKFERMPGIDNTEVGEDNQSFFRVVISGKTFWVEASYLIGCLFVMLPEEYDK